MPKNSNYLMSRLAIIIMGALFATSDFSDKPAITTKVPTQYNDTITVVADSNGTLPSISINLSGKTLLKPSLVEDYCAIREKYNIKPSQIEIEITESAIVENFAEVNKRIKELKDAGFTISMDDFGTGVSSLNRLQDINVDILKLDRGFINKTFEEEKGILIMRNILSMSKDLKIETVAEGIETKEQFELLKDMGCDIGQGYYLSRPLIQADFEALLFTT